MYILDKIVFPHAKQDNYIALERNLKITVGLDMTVNIIHQLEDLSLGIKRVIRKLTIFNEVFQA